MFNAGLKELIAEGVMLKNGETVKLSVPLLLLSV